MKAVTIFALLLTITVSWPNNPNAISLDSLKEPWFDDIDGPGFLRGAEQQTQEERELDSSNDLPDDVERDARNEIVTTVTSLKETIICLVPAHPNGTITSAWDGSKNPINALHYPCEAYPTMVRLEGPAGLSMIGDTVRLHRCVGSCSSPNLMHCTVIRQEEVKVEYIYMDGNTGQTGYVTVYNHTQCGCGCMTSKSDCNDAIHNYNANECKCECKGDINSCNQAIHTWDDTNCECKCKIAKKPCDSTTKHKWNPKICDCDYEMEV